MVKKAKIEDAGNRPIAFAQCQLRHDYVEGTDSSPVGYLEGVFVSGFTCLWDLRKPIGSSALEKICRFGL